MQSVIAQQPARQEVLVVASPSLGLICYGGMISVIGETAAAAANGSAIYLAGQLRYERVFHPGYTPMEQAVTVTSCLSLTLALVTTIAMFVITCRCRYATWPLRWLVPVASVVGMAALNVQMVIRAAQFEQGLSDGVGYRAFHLVAAVNFSALLAAIVALIGIWVVCDEIELPRPHRQPKPASRHSRPRAR